MASPSTFLDVGSQVKRLHRYVRAAAELRLEMLNIELDSRRRCRGQTIIYCIDTNIIDLYLSPDHVGPRSPGGGNGYGVVFPEDPPILSSALAAGLSRYIFFELDGLATGEGKIPPVLLIGHDAEARRRYNSLSAVYSQHLADARQKKTELERALEESFNRPDVNLDGLDDPRTIFELIFGAGNPAERFRRFNHLIARGRISRLPIVATWLSDFWKDDGDLNKYRDALNVPRSIHEQIEESALRLAWHDRLEFAKSARSIHNVRADAAALARLELVNRRLEGTRLRLVLISGDEAMHRACHDYRPGIEGDGTFAALFLRHPRAFLSSMQILARSEVKVSRQRTGTSADLVVDWLDSLLVRYVDHMTGPNVHDLKLLRQRNNRQLRKRLVAAVRDDPGAPDRIKREWDQHTKILIEQHTATSPLARDEIGRILGKAKIGRFSDTLKEFDDQLLEQSEDTWQSFFEAVLHAGFDIDMGDQDARLHRTRNAPPLVLGVFPAAQTFVRRILSDESADVRALVKAEMGDIRREDPSGYATVLCYATIYATFGNWYVARLLGDRAITIANRELRESKPVVGLVGVQERITGREACYFAAVARRHCARSRDDLQGIRDLIDDAEAASVLDRPEGAFGERDDVRFVAERLALELTRQLFEWFGERRVEVIDSCGMLLRLMSALQSVLEAVDSLDDKWMALVIERKCLTNFFMAFAMTESLERSHVDAAVRTTGIDVPGDDVCRSLLSRFGENMSNGSNIALARTILTVVVELYARVRFATIDPYVKRALKRELQSTEWHIRRAGEAAIAMPYDVHRYEFLLDRSKSLLT